MSARMKCPHCQSSYTFPETYDGKAVRCKNCDKPFRVRLPALPPTEIALEPAVEIPPYLIAEAPPRPVATASEIIAADEDLNRANLPVYRREPEPWELAATEDAGLLPPPEEIRLAPTEGADDNIGPSWLEQPVLLELLEEPPESPLVLEVIETEPAPVLELVEDPTAPILEFAEAPATPSTPQTEPIVSENAELAPQAAPAVPESGDPAPVQPETSAALETAAPFVEPPIVPELVEDSPAAPVEDPRGDPEPSHRKRDREPEKRPARRDANREFSPPRKPKRNIGWLILLGGFIFPITLITVLIVVFAPDPKKKRSDDGARNNRSPVANDQRIPPPDEIDNPFPPNIGPPMFDPGPLKFNPPEFPPKFDLGPLRPPKVDPGPPPRVEPPVKRDRVIVPSSPYSDDGAHGIKPAPLKNDVVEVALPAKHSRVCLGGGGRWFLFVIPTRRALAVFDLNEARVVKELPLPEDEVHVAAGRSHFFVLLPQARRVERWSFAGLVKEASLESPVGDAHAFVVGHCSDGPLIIQEKGPGARLTSKARCYDPKTLRPLAIRDFETLQRSANQSDLRVSADGRVLTARDPKDPVQELRVGVIDGDRLKLIVNNTQVWTQVPDAEGGRVFTGKGLYALANTGAESSGSLDDRFVAARPATHGLFSLQVQVYNPHEREDELRLRWGEEEAVLATLGGEKRQSTDGPHRYIGAATTNRLHLVPAAKAVVFLPTTSDRVVLSKFDATAALHKSGIDYLRLANRPVTEAVKGTTYNYLLAAHARQGPVRARIETGPAGMKMMEDGRLTWAVPVSFSEAEVDVKIVLGRDGGREISRGFRISVR